MWSASKGERTAATVCGGWKLGQVEIDITVHHAIVFQNSVNRSIVLQQQIETPRSEEACLQLEQCNISRSPRKITPGTRRAYFDRTAQGRLADAV